MFLNGFIKLLAISNVKKTICTTFDKSPVESQQENEFNAHQDFEYYKNSFDQTISGSFLNHINTDTTQTYQAQEHQIFIEHNSENEEEYFQMIPVECQNSAESFSGLDSVEYNQYQHNTYKDNFYEDQPMYSEVIQENTSLNDEYMPFAEYQQDIQDAPELPNLIISGQDFLNSEKFSATDSLPISDGSHSIYDSILSSYNFSYSDWQDENTFEDYIGVEQITDSNQNIDLHHISMIGSVSDIPQKESENPEIMPYMSDFYATETSLLQESIILPTPIKEITVFNNSAVQDNDLDQEAIITDETSNSKAKTRDSSIPRRKKTNISKPMRNSINNRKHQKINADKDKSTSLNEKEDQRPETYYKEQELVEEIESNNRELSEEVNPSEKINQNEKFIDKKYSIIYYIIENGFKSNLNLQPNNDIDSETVNIDLLTQNLIKIRYDCLGINSIIYWLDKLEKEKVSMFCSKHKILIIAFNKKINEYDIEKAKLEAFYTKKIENTNKNPKPPMFINCNKSILGRNCIRIVSIKCKKFKSTLFYDWYTYRKCLFDLNLLIYGFIDNFFNENLVEYKKCFLYKLYFYEYIICIHNLVENFDGIRLSFKSLADYSSSLFKIRIYTNNSKDVPIKLVFHTRSYAFICNWALMFTNTDVELKFFKNEFSFPKNLVKKTTQTHQNFNKIIKNCKRLSKKYNIWRKITHFDDFDDLDDLDDLDDFDDFDYWILNYTEMVSQLCC